MSRVLELDQVGKAYRLRRGSQAVLKDVDLVLNRGDFLAVTGPSGSGKSTLLNLCALLDDPDQGSVRLGGERVSGLDQKQAARIRARRIGIVFQKCELLPYRSVLDNVLFRFRYHKTGSRQWRLERAMALIEEMGLSDLWRKPARLLSGGEMQRVAIARAVVMTPDLLVADEPTGNLDGNSAKRVMDCFSRLNREHGISILLVTHNADLLRYCNRHLECRDGRLAEAAKAA